MPLRAAGAGYTRDNIYYLWYTKDLRKRDRGVSAFFGGETPTI